MQRFFLRWYWSLRVLWQGIGGRWYVFREAPDWICAEWAALDDSDDDEIRALARQALAELQLRVDRLRRMVERAEVRKGCDA